MGGPPGGVTEHRWPPWMVNVEAAGARWRLASLAFGRPDPATAPGWDRDQHPPARISVEVWHAPERDRRERPRPSSVSVIVPAYNAAATLAEQLEALAAQRFDGDWELVIVDNGPPTVPRIWRGATGSASRSSH